LIFSGNFDSAKGKNIHTIITSLQTKKYKKFTEKKLKYLIGLSLLGCGGAHKKFSM